MGEHFRAELSLDPPTVYPGAYYNQGYYPGYYGGWVNPLTAMQNYLAAQSKMLAYQASMAAATAVAQTKAQLANMGNSIVAYQINQAKTNPASILPGKYGNWIRSARYDFPEGGDIDMYNNRLCWGSVCKHDPQSSNNLNTEWLRRAVPMRDYPSPPAFHSMHGEISPPDRECSLIPYDEIKDATTDKMCFSKVYAATNVPITPKMACMPVLVTYRRQLDNFI